MENKYTSITFKAKVEPIKPVNPEFDLCKVYVQSVGKNRNCSYMSKENIESYLPTLNYCPVVGHIIECADEEGNIHRYVGGHDFTITENWEIKDLTVPYGVVVENSYDWEIINEYGKDVEYLTANAILWTGRYPELKDCIYSEDFWFNQSMEINIPEGKYRPLEEDSNYTELLEWTYSALCLLGKADANSTTGHTDSKEHTEPCFISSKVIPIEFSKSEFSNLMDEMKEKISFCFNNQTSNIGIDVNSDKGGKNLDEKLVILQKFNKTVEDLDFSIDEMSVEDLETKMEELFGVSEPETTVEPEVSNPLEFSATYKQKRQALNNVLDPIIVKDENGNYVEETYFYIEDFSDEYVYVERSHWSANDYTCTFGRYTYEFDEATLTATLTSEFEEMVKMWLTLEEKENLEKERLENEAKFANLEKEFNEYKEQYSVSNADFESLKSYKENKEAEERMNAENALFADYEEAIGETEEFKALKEKASEFSLDALKKECLCIVGMYSMTRKAKEVEKTNPLKFSLEPKVEDNDPYGGIHNKYLGK